VPREGCCPAERRAGRRVSAGRRGGSRRPLEVVAPRAAKHEQPIGCNIEAPQVAGQDDRRRGTESAREKGARARRAGRGRAPTLSVERAQPAAASARAPGRAMRPRRNKLRGVGFEHRYAVGPVAGGRHRVRRTASRSRRATRTASPAPVGPVGERLPGQQVLLDVALYPSGRRGLSPAVAGLSSSKRPERRRPASRRGGRASRARRAERAAQIADEDVVRSAKAGGSASSI